MTPGQFIAKWQAATLTERAASQSHFNDLCAPLDFFCSTHLRIEEVVRTLLTGSPEAECERARAVMIGAVNFRVHALGHETLPCGHLRISA